MIYVLCHLFFSITSYKNMNIMQVAICLYIRSFVLSVGTTIHFSVLPKRPLEPLEEPENSRNTLSYLNNLGSGNPQYAVLCCMTTLTPYLLMSLST